MVQVQGTRRQWSIVRLVQWTILPISLCLGILQFTWVLNRVELTLPRGPPIEKLTPYRGNPSTNYLTASYKNLSDRKEASIESRDLSRSETYSKLFTDEVLPRRPDLHMATSTPNRYEESKGLSSNEELSSNKSQGNGFVTSDPRHSSLAQKPLLVLHVGPPKTGTTSLQYMIGVYESLLREDNYFYAGNSSYVDRFNICTRRLRNSPGVQHECWIEILNHMENHRQAGHSFILSNELLSVRAVEDFDLLRNFTEAWMPNVLVVVGYRHLHNFFQSTYFELQKNQRWPSKYERGKLVIPFVTFWNSTHGQNRIGPMPTPATTINTFRERNYNVSILNIETKEQISEFFCHILPNANRTCEHHKTQPHLIPTLNQREEGRLNYDSLAILAFLHGMIKNTQTRSYVRSKIKEFNEGTLHHGPDDFELQCLDASQEEQFLQESISHARAAGFPNFDDIIRVDFPKAKEKKKFCSIDAAAVFHTKIWQDFLSNAVNW